MKGLTGVARPPSGRQAIANPETRSVRPGGRQPAEHEQVYGDVKDRLVLGEYFAGRTVYQKLVPAMWGIRSVAGHGAPASEKRRKLLEIRPITMLHWSRGAGDHEAVQEPGMSRNNFWNSSRRTRTGDPDPVWIHVAELIADPSFVCAVCLTVVAGCSEAVMMKARSRTAAGRPELQKDRGGPIGSLTPKTRTGRDSKPSGKGWRMIREGEVKGHTSAGMGIIEGTEDESRGRLGIQFECKPGGADLRTNLRGRCRGRTK